MANTREVASYARRTMNDFGLGHWRFEFDRAVKRFGVCKYGPNVISLSEKLVLANTLERCQEVVLHEIAHALAGHKAGHGPAWKAQCRLIGARPVRCYDLSDTVSVAKYSGFCSACGDKPITSRAQAPVAVNVCKRHRVKIVWKDSRGRVVEIARKKFVQQCDDCGHVFASKARNSSQTWRHTGGCGGTVRINFNPGLAAIR